MTALASAYNGIANLSSIPDEQRIHDRDRILIRIARGNLAMSKIVITEFKSKNFAAKDPEPIYKQDIDRTILLNIGASSSQVSGLIHKIWVPDAHAQYIDEGCTLIVRGVYYNGTAWATTIAATNCQEEMLLVRERGTSTGGNTYFIVQRGFQPAPGGTAGTPTTLGTSHKLVYIPRAVAEGNNEGRVWGDTPFEDSNYCEFNLEKWGVNIQVANTTIYQDESVEDRNGRRTNDHFWKGYEMKLIYGRKHKTTDAAGDTIWRTGGLQEFILKTRTDIGYDTANVVDFSGTYGALSYQSFNRAFQDKFFFGSKDKFLMLDVYAYTKICNAFDNKIRIHNQTLSGKYGIRIETIMVSGGNVHLVVHDLLSINGFTNHGYLVDFDFFKYMHLQNLDTQIVKDAERGQNIFKTVNYMFQQAGVKRTNQFAHWYFINF